MGIISVVLAGMSTCVLLDKLSLGFTGAGVMRFQWVQSATHCAGNVRLGSIQAIRIVQAAAQEHTAIHHLLRVPIAMMVKRAVRVPALAITAQLD